MSGQNGRVWLRAIIAGVLLIVCGMLPPRLGSSPGPELPPGPGSLPGLTAPARTEPQPHQDRPASPAVDSSVARVEDTAAVPSGIPADVDALEGDIPADVAVPPSERSRHAEELEEKAALRRMKPAKKRAQDTRVIIDISGLKLMLLRDGEIIRTYPIAAGKPSTPSPRGEFTATAIERYPTWYPRGGRPVPPGPSNPLGSRWISLSDSGYGVHGTNDDSSIGKYVSKGCIRMHNEDVEELCGLISVGIPVIMTDAPDVSGDVYALPGAKTNRSLPGNAED